MTWFSLVLIGFFAGLFLGFFIGMVSLIPVVFKMMESVYGSNIKQIRDSAIAETIARFYGNDKKNR